MSLRDTGIVATALAVISGAGCSSPVAVSIDTGLVAGVLRNFAGCPIDCRTAPDASGQDYGGPVFRLT